MKKKARTVAFFLICRFSYAQLELKLWEGLEKPYYKENDLKEFEKEIWGTKVVGRTQTY